jgi:hypothetical protein
MHNVTDCADAGDAGRVSVLRMDFAPGSEADAMKVTSYMALRVRRKAAELTNRRRGSDRRHTTT